MADTRNITVQEIEALRKQTNFTLSIQDCKRALIECGKRQGNAFEWLKENGFIRKEKFDDWVFPDPDGHSISAYSLAKAQCFLRMAPEAFDERCRTFFDICPDTVEKARSALEQLVAGKGLSPEDPLTGIGVEGFYAMTTILDYSLVLQCATFHEEFILDKMVVSHRFNGDEMTLFNRVEKHTGMD
jgi:hypothetical protein